MLICTPIQHRSQKEVAHQLQQLKGKVDIAEVWLDHIQDLNISALLKNPPLPLLCVCKKALDKGLFKGSYQDQADILMEVVQHGSHYIDIPLKMPEKYSNKIIQEIRNQKSEIKTTKVIFSYHHFKKTPSKAILLKKIKEMRRRGADIVKIAVMGHNLQDSLNMIFLAKELESQNIPHILITMGQQGILTRVLTPFLGGTMMFAPLENSGSTAAGQLTVSELREAWSSIEK